MTLEVTIFAISKAGSEYCSFSDKFDSKESKVGLASSAAIVLSILVLYTHFYCH